MNLFKKKQIINNKNAIPAHIAIIMDGNGRWAKKRGLPRSAGHRAGAQTLKKIINYASEIGVKFLTVYTFSTENWKRPEQEVNDLMALLLEYLKDAPSQLIGKNNRIRFIGDVTPLTDEIKKEITYVEGISKENTGLTVNIALNYGGRDEIIYAARKIAQKVADGEITASEISEDMFSKNIYTDFCPDPDLIIRPSGELRLSNFLLWQCAYSEFWFSNINWPDFSPKDLDNAINDYIKRSRRYGGV